MTKPDDRRSYPRLDLTEEASVYDDQGRRLGRVRQASGGGMLVEAENVQQISHIQAGDRMRMIVKEPNSRDQHSFSTIVRHVRGNTLGVEFASSASR